MAQRVFPWQMYGHGENAPPAPPSTGGLGKSTKRSRSKEDHGGSDKSSNKRRSGGTSASGINNSHRVQMPGAYDVIDLVGEEENRPPQQSKPLSNGPNKPWEHTQEHPGALLGTQQNPFAIDISPPIRPQFAPAYNDPPPQYSDTPPPHYHLPPPHIGYPPGPHILPPQINHRAGPPIFPPSQNDYPGGLLHHPPPQFIHSPAPFQHHPPPQFNYSAGPPIFPPEIDHDAPNQASHPTPHHAPPQPLPLPSLEPVNSIVDDVVPIVEPDLCEEQAKLVDLIMSRRNVFYTGSAGCGKSTVLKAFVKRFAAQGMRVNIIAPTGRAALDINGSTTWTYAGWTPDSHKKPLKQLKAAAHGKFVRARLCETEVLVIDEISMVENLHFERLNTVMKEARNSDAAFGGVQLIVTGDFCQLPPVKPFGHCIECGGELTKNKEETEYKCRLHGTYYDIDKWAFRSKAWQECNFEHVNLTTIHRQNDKVFIDILNKLRMGIPLPQPSIDLLLNHESQTRNAIKLFATREEVKRVNDQMFRNLPTKPRTYKCLDHFKWNEKHGNLRNKGDKGPDGSLLALREHRFESQIELKKGMLVVLLHNLDLGSGLVNGSQGTIQGFEDYEKAKMPKAASNRRDDSSMPGVPTLQGDHAVFREGQLDQFVKQMKTKAWPVVRFLNGVERTIYADCTVNELGDEAPHSLLSRTQIPLMAAWAMTTHKSQGMTLNRVIVNLAKSFEQGQAYVALSRARSLEGLKVEAFPRSAQGAGNPQVKEFLREKFNIM